MLIDYIDQSRLPDWIVWLDWHIYANFDTFLVSNLAAGLTIAYFSTDDVSWWMKIICSVVGGTIGFMIYAFIRHGRAVG